MSSRVSRSGGASVASLLLIAVLCGCSASDDAADAESIPTRPVPPTAPATVVTEPGGAPVVEQFVAPDSFVCLAEDPRQAQVTVGWDVPTATDVTILLDGAPVHSGIHDELPFAVTAGTARGIGSTIVFDCAASDARTITIQWTVGASPPAEHVVQVVREADDA